ncbi:hypothetical protein WA158_006068 [Blastocystis sp. Blastoise]
MSDKSKQPNKINEEHEKELESLLFADLDGNYDDVLQSQKPSEQTDDDSEEEKPLWHDDDDDEVEVNLVSTNRLRKLRADTEETKVTGTEFNKRLREHYVNGNEYQKIFALPKRRKVGEEENDDEIFRNSVAFIKNSSTLEGGLLRVRHCVDANSEQYANSVISSCRFHPTTNVLLTAGKDKAVRLFDIDGEKNLKVGSVYFDDLPITHCEWSNNGNQFIATGNKPRIYIYDVNKAKNTKISTILGCSELVFENIITSRWNTNYTLLGQKGGIYILDSRTGKTETQMRGANKMTGGSYVKNGTEMYTVSFDGSMYSWDLRTRTCISAFKDTSILSAVTCACNDTHMAIGCSSGFLNMYSPLPGDNNTGNSSSSGVNSISPVKMFDNLTTSISSIAFNDEGNLVAYASRSQKDQLKVVHVPSMTVYSNWPTAKTPLQYVSSLSFSHSSEYIAIGNDKGRVTLYSLPFYTNKRKEREALEN